MNLCKIIFLGGEGGIHKVNIIEYNIDIFLIGTRVALDKGVCQML